MDPMRKVSKLFCTAWKVGYYMFDLQTFLEEGPAIAVNPCQNYEDLHVHGKVNCKLNI